MASKTTGNKRSYAAVAKAEREKSNFAALAVCRLKAPPELPTKYIPNTKELYSFFVDKESTDASEAQVINAINIEGIVGANARDDLRVIEFVCENEASLEKAMATTFTVEGKRPFVAILPRHKTNLTVLVKLANVPFGNKNAITNALVEYWTQYGKVLDLAPYQFPGKPWLTKRWDILIQLKDGEKKLTAPTVFTVEGCPDTIVCSWPRSTKACLRCKVSGHSTSSCTANKPKTQKVGALANPHQKIGNVGQDKNRAAKATQSATTAAAPATSTATSASPATVATPNPVPSVAFTVALSPATSATTAATSGVSAGIFSAPTLTPPVDVRGKGPEQRTLTPPPLVLQDPDTPKKGNKRQAKNDDPWTPEYEALRHYVKSNKLCLICFVKGHMAFDCKKRKRQTAVALKDLPRVAAFRPLLEEWANSRRKKGIPWRFYDERADGPYSPPECTKCGQIGHTDLECASIPLCNHCGLDHLGIDCPDKPTYAYEAMKE